MEVAAIGLIIAAVWALTKGTINVIDYNKEYKEAQAEIEQQVKDLNDVYWLEKAAVADKFVNAKEEANETADKLDLQADIQDAALNAQEEAVSNQYNQGIESVQAQQEADLFNWNNALASIGANTGNELAAIAGNGTRAGSSLSQAVELEAAANNATLNLEMNNADKQNTWNLQNLFSQNTIAKNDIWQGRVSADQNRYDATDLRNDYLEGGGKWQEYQDQLSLMNINYNQRKNNLWRQYNKNASNKGWNAFSAFFKDQGNDFMGAYNTYNTVNNSMSY